MEFEGYIKFPKTDKYKIYLSSDDGSRIFIDNKEILINDGIHGIEEEKETEIIVQKGFHKIKIEYFQVGYGKGLNIKIESSSFSKKNIPRSWYFREVQ